MSYSAQIWPNLAPTLPTSLHARCSIEGRRVDHVVERAPPLLPCVPPPRHTSLLLPLAFGEARRPPRSLSALPHLPLLALPCCNPAHGRVHHGRLAELTATASLLPPGSLASYHVCHRLRHRAPLLLACGSLLLPPSGHRRRAVPAVSARSQVAKPPRTVCGQAEWSPGCSWARWCSRALLHRRRPSFGRVSASPPAIPCSLL